MSSSTYLDVVNKVLREINEVPLTQATFPNAVGIQQFVKDSVKTALYDINTYYYKWPFLSATTSTEPHLGNATVATTAGTRWYLIKTGSTGVDTDYQFVDWDSFVLTTEGVVGESTPYTVKRLKPIMLEDWIKFRSQYEAEDEANSQNYGVPVYVIRHPDGRRFGLSYIPDKEYNIYFFAWKQIDAISVYNDTFPFSEQWVHSVLIPRVRHYSWMFKENPQQSQMADGAWKQGIRRMFEQLVADKAKNHFRDDRVRVP